MNNIYDKCARLLWIRSEITSAQIELFNNLSINDTKNNHNILKDFMADFTDYHNELMQEIIHETGMADMELETCLKYFSIFTKR